MTNPIEEIKRQAQQAQKWLDEKAQGLTGDEHGVMHTYLDRIECAEKLIAASELLQQQQWQPIDSAPRDGSLVAVILEGTDKLVTQIPYKETHCVFFHSNEGWLSAYAMDTIENQYYKITAWQPLPQPPKEQNDRLKN